MGRVAGGCCHVTMQQASTAAPEAEQDLLPWATPLWLGAGEFANATAGALYVDAAGHWLADPLAVLFGTNGDTPAKALVRLSSPKLAANKSALTFQVSTA